MQEIIAHIDSASEHVGATAACRAIGFPRTTYYRHKSAPETVTPRPKHDCRVPGRALTETEREQVIEVLHSERFKDMAVPQVFANLIDDGVYHCSVSTMYRILRDLNEVKDRRNQRTHTPAQRPELLATKPNEVWSWDISKLKAPKKWTYYYLYVVMDIFSRCVVGWCISEQTSASVAEALIQDAACREQIDRDTLTIHADNGGEMISKTVSDLLIDLGIIKSHSRPHTSNDNPFSESHFKTMKYRPEIPARFSSVEDAREIFRRLFDWYNHEHRHSGIAMLTPAMVHSGRAKAVVQARASVLNVAYASHPERFVNKPPTPEQPPKEVWINPPLVPSEASRDDTKVVVCGEKELPPARLSASEAKGSKKRAAEPSRDASEGAHATAS